MAKRRVLIIANLTKDEAAVSAREIAGHLAIFDVFSEIFASSYPSPSMPDPRGFDLVISLGGDGTVLFAARLAAPHGIPVLPFNLGRLGFIAGFGRTEWLVVLDSWLEGRLDLSARTMLSIIVRRGSIDLASFIALNDGVVSGQGIAKVISLELKVGGHALGVYRSDGIIVATPTGSTAYNLAAGGPVLHPEMDCMVLNPICPFTLSNRPLVVPSNERIELLVDEGKRTNVILTVDGQETHDLEPGDRLFFSKALRKALIYTPERLAFYDLLKSKLNWSGGTDA
jgi:NAD+ kinase